MGVCHTDRDSATPGISTLVLLGPAEPGFWPVFEQSDEYKDGDPDPLDRWSVRVIEDLARRLEAKAYFPFGGPPHHPFTRWARDSGRAHISPVGLLVHDRAGLMLSFRGALGFKERFELPDTPPNPCFECENQPCKQACPVGALTADTYDVVACKADLHRPENDCMAKGCAARRACPISRTYGRIDRQSAFHMAAFQ